MDRLLWVRGATSEQRRGASSSNKECKQCHRGMFRKKQGQHGVALRPAGQLLLLLP